MPQSKSRNNDAICFGLIMQRLRRQRGWSLQYLGEVTGMNGRYLGMMEHGYNVPSIDTLILISSIFGVDPPDVLREMIEFRKTYSVQKGK